LIVKKVKNIEKVVGKNWNQISTQDLLKANFIVFQNQALKKIMERIG
jgi:ribosomal protein L4